MPVTILGPQRPVANLPEVLGSLGVRGPVALISAGWRYDEDRDEPVRAALAMTVHNLRLYQAYAEIEREAPDLARAYGRKQSELIRVKGIYRAALAPAVEAVRALWADRRDPTCPFFEAALRHLHALDRLFLAQAATLHRQFDEEVRPARHPLVWATNARVRDILAGVDAVLLAGGHVGILRNRLAFFGIDRLLAGQNVVGWSAGAMVLGERVMLYHDHVPGESRPAEYLDLGVGLVPDTVFLPHAHARLKLDDADAVALLAARIEPLRAIALEPGAWLPEGQRSVGRAGAAWQLTATGVRRPLEDQ